MEIPPYPDSRPLSLSDKPILDQLFSDMQSRISELTSAGLYLFRHAHDYRISAIENSIIVQGKGYDGTEYFLPPPGNSITKALHVMFSDGKTLYGADEQYIDRYLTGMNLVFQDLRDSYDYLYVREELAALPGSRFHKKKNRINYFTNRHNYTSALFSSVHISGCHKLLDQWTQYSAIDSALIQEVEAASEALDSAETLGLEGVVVTVNDRVAAFALGERLNKDTAVCHFEKADPFCEGLFQLINREFARMLFQECHYLNREQDLGNMGLRNAKLSYHPVELIKKQLIKLRS